MQHSSGSQLGARVLLVDDEPRVRRMLGMALHSAGFCVLEAANQLDLQRILAHTRPDAVVLDLQRSYADGLALLTRMRARQTLCEVPIVFLAGNQDDDCRWQARRAGADWFGLRPLGIRELRTHLGDLIRTGRRPVPEPPTLAHDDVGQLAWHDDDALNGARGYVRLNAG